MTEPTFDSDTARVQLYEIMRADCSFEQKAEQALDLGTQYLGVENGHVTKIDEQSDYWKSIASTDPVGGEFPPGAPGDLVVLEAPSYRHLPYRYDENVVGSVLKDGDLVVEV